MLKRLLSEEKGQSLVIVSIFLTVLIGFSGLAIDGGRLYLAKSQLQKAVDAGVLAGADALLDDEETKTTFNYTLAVDKASTISTANYDSGIPYEAKAYYDNLKKVSFVEVNGEEKVQLMLMPILGIDNISEVRASATVKIGKVTKANKGTILPIGIQFAKNAKLVSGEIVSLTEVPGEGVMGNYNLLDFSSLGDGKGPSGAQGVGYYIEQGAPVAIPVGQSIYPEPGVEIKSTPINNAIVKRIGDIIYVPVISEFGPGKSQPVTVLGFSAFKLLPLPADGKTIRAQFLRTQVPGEIGNVPTEEVPYVSKLVS